MPHKWSFIEEKERILPVEEEERMHIYLINDT